MKIRLKIYTLLIITGLFLAACNAKSATVEPTQAPQPTNAKATQSADQPSTAATQADYPAPPQVDPSGAATDYPAPPVVVPPLTETGYPAPGTFKLTLADGSVKSVAVDTLKTLPTKKVAFDGTELDVLPLVDALKQSGVEAYSQVTVSGSGNILTLTKDQVAQSFMELLADGTIRLAIQGQPQNAWIVALSSMIIE